MCQSYYGEEQIILESLHWSGLISISSLSHFESGRYASSQLYMHTSVSTAFKRMNN